MEAVRQVVYDQQFAVIGRKRLFPALVKGVMVFNQPIGLQAGQDGAGLPGVSLPVATQPCGMGLFGQGVIRRCGHQVACRECSQGMTALANDFQQVARVLAADEMAMHAFRRKGISQGQTAHDVATAHE